MLVKTNENVDVIIAGMPRSGTTSLYHLFDKHPGFFVPFRKETAYFSYNYNKGIAWYKDLYSDKKKSQLGMDISPQYFIDNDALKRIQKQLPNAKIILSIRDPIDWVKSNYHQIKKFEKVPHIEAFMQNYMINTSSGAVKYELGDRFVTNTIKLAQNLFGENLLLFRFEHFKEHPLEVLHEIENFCEVEQFFSNENFSIVKVNSSDQMNIRMLTWLLSRETFISFIDLIFPRQFIKSVRKAFDILTSRRIPVEKNNIFSKKEIKAIDKTFHRDRIWIDNLFSSKKFVVGKNIKN